MKLPAVKLSVVICTRNRPQDVAVCLPTILACLRDDWQVVLVDQSDGSDTRAIAERLAAVHPSLHYLPTATVGKSRALDIGISHTRGEILAFTDDDCEAPPDWLERVVAEFKVAPGVDILFGPVLPSPAIPEVQSVCVPAWSFPEARDMRPGEVCGMGANMALRRAALARLPDGPRFDPALGPGAPFPAGEEGDFVYRLRRAGRVAPRPTAVPPGLADAGPLAVRPPRLWGGGRRLFRQARALRRRLGCAAARRPPDLPVCPRGS